MLMALSKKGLEYNLTGKQLFLDDFFFTEKRFLGSFWTAKQWHLCGNREMNHMLALGTFDVVPPSNSPEKWLLRTVEQAKLFVKRVQIKIDDLNNYTMGYLI